MTAIRLHALCIAVLALVCAGCASPLVQKPVKLWEDLIAGEGKQELRSGIDSYEEGAYRTAAKRLQAALELGLNVKSDQARAHKYLAFIGCAAGREKACREDFRKALNADPDFDLLPAEAGHPIWGPVFRAVKAEAAGKAKPR